VQFRNRVVNVRNPNGKGQGLELAAEKAGLFGAELHHEFQNNKSEFVALLAMPNTFQLDQTIPRFVL
jgi:hypothetical protein